MTYVKSQGIKDTKLIYYFNWDTGWGQGLFISRTYTVVFLLIVLSWDMGPENGTSQTVILTLSDLVLGSVRHRHCS